MIEVTLLSMGPRAEWGPGQIVPVAQPLSAALMPPNLIIENVPEMSCVLTTGNVSEMSSVLATGNVPEILPYTVPGNVKISRNRKCSYHEQEM